MSEQPDNWRSYAACRGLDPDLFYPGRGESAAAAREVCDACPVRPQCREFALVTGERFGVWGGLSERERHRLRSRRSKAA